ncbi:hypothetical protein ES288_D09G202200v1 [Gossypium darwinii]|uniref:Uncharacterized protein n=2 Tax=Gossypium TaxID=3633 RepID=A0A5D2JK54_GOSTO|nr:hypothetical protein ES288_D09G202200v1 [Gossypium darwinii]TYH54826.1 hypothetical protein ES332_D09G197700v1 [Gossypium tomentosum]
MFLGLDFLKPKPKPSKNPKKKWNKQKLDPPSSVLISVSFSSMKFFTIQRSFSPLGSSKWTSQTPWTGQIQTGLAFVL